MKPSARDQLLREILADEEVDRLRADSLAGMLRVARRKRQRRAALSVAASLVVALTTLVAWRRESQSGVLPQTFHGSRPNGTAKPAGVKVITDEQLLALFSDRSVALIGRPGEQRLVFLDAPQSRAAH